MEPYNPPYYLNHWLSVGFQTYQEYYSKTVEDLESLVERTARFAEKSASRGYTVRHLKMKNFYCELRTLYNLSVKIFNENLLFTPIDYPEFEGLYTGSRALIDPECVLFALDRTGTPAGFLFGFPDEFSAVRSMRGHKHLIARFRFLRRKGRARIMNAKSLGILPDHRGAGLAGMLMHQLYRVALNRGFNRVNLCLFHESNPSGSLEAGLGAISRKYKLLKKTLETTIRE